MKGSNGPSNGSSEGWVHRPYDEMEVRDMAIPWKWFALAALAAITAILLVIVTTAEPSVSYEELTRIIGPVAI
jgi:hypothetical protein